MGRSRVGSTTPRRSNASRSPTEAARETRTGSRARPTVRRSVSPSSVPQSCVSCTASMASKSAATGVPYANVWNLAR